VDIAGYVLGEVGPYVFIQCQNIHLRIGCRQFGRARQQGLPVDPHHGSRVVTDIGAGDKQYRGNHRYA
jgi:hypothetical protein